MTTHHRELSAGLILATLFTIPLAIFAQGNIFDRMKKKMEDVQKKIERATQGQATQPQRGGQTSTPSASASGSAVNPLASRVEIAGVWIGPGNPIGVRLKNPVDSAQLHEGDTVAAVLPKARIATGPSADVVVKVLKLGAPVDGGGYADVSLELVSIDNNGTPLAISNTTVRLLTSQSDLEKALAESQSARRSGGKGKAAARTRSGAAARPDPGAQAEIEDIFGIAKQPVRLPAQFDLVFKIGLSHTYRAPPSSLSPHVPQPHPEGPKQ